MNILCITPVKHINGVYEILESCGCVTYEPYATAMTTRVMSDINDAIFTNPNEMTFKLDANSIGEGVKVICTASTGTNHIDLDYCDKRGIEILSLTTDYDIIERISSTAEMAFALMMALLRNVTDAFDSVKRGEWTYEPFIGRQLNQLKAGVVGFGRLGKMMAKYCKAFGMNVCVCDPYKAVHDAYTQTSLGHIFRGCDVISLHIHLNEETKGMINRSLLDECRGYYLINTSRGDIVNEEDVIWALEETRLYGYATDVLSDELGNIKNSPIINRADDLNIIVTPHIGGMTKEAQEIAYIHAAKKILLWVNK